MPRIAALYRYPMKGFTPEPCEVLSVLDEGRIAGDRVLGVRFGNSAVPDDAWTNKHEMIALVNTPGLAHVRLQFDHRSLRLRIGLEGVILVDEALDDEGRQRIAAVIEQYVLRLDPNPLASHPERLPLRVVGDGVTPRHHDSAAGRVTLHSRASLAAVAAAVGKSDLSELRFRSNIAIEGLAAWEEQNWVGRKLRVGAVQFDVVSSKGRCLATHVNPETGDRDLPILTTLTSIFPQPKPTFAVAMVTAGTGGEIRVGDPISLIG